MKRFLIASLLLLSSSAYSRITQAPDVSVTAAADDADSVAKANSYIYGMDSTGVNRRVQLNTSGQIVTSSGGGTAGNVSINAGTSVIGAVGVTSTTYASWTQLKSITVTVTGPTTINLTHAAGTSGIMKYQVGSSNSNSAGFYWGPRADATWFNPRNLYATSATAWTDDYLSPGQHIALSPVSATDISNTAEINFWKLTQSVP